MSGEHVLASQLLPFGIQVSDLEYISDVDAGIAAVVISAIGIVLPDACSPPARSA